MKICIYGASSDDISKNHIEKTYELGQKLALAGHSLVFGGGAHGLMGAAARGFADKKGEIIGVSPKFFDHDDILYPNCTELIFTNTMRERKQIMEDKSDAFVVTPGGIGTFEEFFEILTLKQLERHNKPIAIFNTDGYYNPMIELLNHAVTQGFMRKACMDIFKVTDNADELIDYIDTYDKTKVDLSHLKY